MSSRTFGAVNSTSPSLHGDSEASGRALMGGGEHVWIRIIRLMNHYIISRWSSFSLKMPQECPQMDTCMKPLAWNQYSQQWADRKPLAREFLEICANKCTCRNQPLQQFRSFAKGQWLVIISRYQCILCSGGAGSAWNHLSCQGWEWSTKESIGVPYYHEAAGAMDTSGVLFWFQYSCHINRYRMSPRRSCMRFCFYCLQSESRISTLPWLYLIVRYLDITKSYSLARQPETAGFQMFQLGGGGQATELVWAGPVHFLNDVCQISRFERPMYFKRRSKPPPLSGASLKP